MKRRRAGEKSRALFSMMMEVFKLKLNRGVKREDEEIGPGMVGPEERAERVAAKCKLTRREREVMGMLLEGKSNRDIEDELFISLKTVKTHVYRIFKKTGVHSRMQLLDLVH